MVYVNYGRKEDFKKLKDVYKINCTGRIVIVRYGKLFRGEKVQILCLVSTILSVFVSYFTCPIDVSACVCVYMRVCVYIRFYVYLYMRVCVCVFAYLCLCIYSNKRRRRISAAVEQASHFWLDLKSYYCFFSLKVSAAFSYLITK